MHKLQKSKLLRVYVAIGIVALLAGGMVGCTKMLKKTAVGPVAGPLVHDLLKTLLDTPSSTLLKEAMPGNALLITAAAEMADTRDMYAITCMIYTSYGMMLEDENEEYAKELFTIGKSFGMRALMTDHNFKKGMEAGKKPPELVELLDKRFVEALTWNGLATGLLIMHQMDDPMALMGLPDSVAYIKRGVELDGTYFFGVGKAFLGAYYAQMPAFLGLGGGPEASAKMFNEARAVTDGTFLMVDVFEARFLLTYLDDQEGFNAMLLEVLETPADVLKGGMAMNDLAHKKAEYFLSIQDTLF